MDKLRKMALAITLLFYGLSGSSKGYRRDSPITTLKKGTVIAHRGASRIAVENTNNAFLAAIKLGAHGVEFDVQLSLDGIPIIFHDEDLRRMTSAKGLVKDTTFDELLKLNVGTLDLGPTGKIPALKDALSVLPQGTIVNVELKDRGYFSAKTFASTVHGVLENHKSRLRFLVSSFDMEVLQAFRQIARDYYIGMLLSEEDWSAAMRKLPVIGPNALHIEPKLFSPCLVRLAKKMGLQLTVWTVNDPNVAKNLIELGADAIITDDPQTILEAVAP